MIDSFRCEICERVSSGMKYVLFYPIERKNIIDIPVRGIHILACLECNLSFQSQFYNLNTKDMNGLIKWYISCEEVKE